MTTYHFRRYEGDIYTKISEVYLNCLLVTSRFMTQPSLRGATLVTAVES